MPLGTLYFQENSEVEIATLGMRLSAIEDFLLARAVFTSPAVDTNTTVTPQTKINGTTPELPAGIYIYKVSFGWNYDIANSSAFVDFTIDGAQVSSTSERILRVEPREVAGNAASQAAEGIAGTGTDTKHMESISYVITHAAAGAHDVLLTFRPEVAGVECSLWDASVIVTRHDFVAGV